MGQVWVCVWGVCAVAPLMAISVAIVAEGAQHVTQQSSTCAVQLGYIPRVSCSVSTCAAQLGISLESPLSAAAGQLPRALRAQAGNRSCMLCGYGTLLAVHVPQSCCCAHAVPLAAATVIGASLIPP